jgi:hypothetical protein
VSTRTWYAFGSQGMAKQATTDGPDWFHGSGATFGRFDMDQDRGHQYGAKHWNSYVGSHFSSEHHTAANLAHESAVGTTPGAVYHATLSAKRTKHYFAEHDMDQEAKSWAEDNGHDYNSSHLSPESWLRYHPKVKEVAHGFRDHLKSQGYDGVTYGNEYEGSHLHECAIAFHPDDITITHRHTPEEDCDAGDEICPDCGHHYEEGSQGYCDKCGAPVGMEGEDDEDEHHLGHLGHLGALTQHFAMAYPPEHFAFPDRDSKDAVYLRFGDWHHSETSQNYVTGHPEYGVSVYDLDKHGKPADPDPHLERYHEHDKDCEPDCDYDQFNDDFGNDTRDEMQGRVQQARKDRNYRQDSRAHLVKGEMVGVGHDGEPLLQKVKTVTSPRSPPRTRTPRRPSSGC